MKKKNYIVSLVYHVLTKQFKRKFNITMGRRIIKKEGCHLPCLSHYYREGGGSDEGKSPGWRTLAEPTI
jgi:hypothetical protein